jgi:hypothetical protein
VLPQRGKSRELKWRMLRWLCILMNWKMLLCVRDTESDFEHRRDWITCASNEGIKAKDCITQKLHRPANTPWRKEYSFSWNFSDWFVIISACETSSKKLFGILLYHLLFFAWQDFIQDSWYFWQSRAVHSVHQPREFQSSCEIVMPFCLWPWDEKEIAANPWIIKKRRHKEEDPRENKTCEDQGVKLTEKGFTKEKTSTSRLLLIIPKLLLTRTQIRQIWNEWVK